MNGAFGSRSGRETIAVLPFERDIDRGERAHLAWALQNHLPALLASNEHLRVLTVGSVTRAAFQSGETRDSTVRLLGAQYVLTGRVATDRDRESVVVSLYRARGTRPIWRASFGSPWTLRRMETAIVSGIQRLLVRQVEATRPPRRVANDASYDALSAGDFALVSTTRAGADSARMFYERALALDPSSAAAATRLARSYISIMERGWATGTVPPQSALKRVAVLTAQALSLDPSFAEAWTVRAMAARLRDPVHFAGAVAGHARAVALAPNDPDAEHQYGLTLFRLGDNRGADAHLRRALELEPNRAATLGALSEIALRGDRWGEACAFSNASLAVWPFDPVWYGVRAQARLHLQQARDAYADAETAARLTGEGWVKSLRVMVEAAAGNDESARQQALILASIWLSPGRTMGVRDASYLAMALSAVRDRRRAVEALRRANPVGTDLLNALQDDALFPLRTDTAVARLWREAMNSGRPQD